MAFSTWKTCLQTFLQTKDEIQLNTSLRMDWLEIYPEDKMEIYQFLYNTTQHKTFAYLFLVDVESQSQNLPWILFLDLVSTSQINVPDPSLTELNQYLMKQKELSSPKKSLGEMITSLRKKRRLAFLQEVSNRKQELLDSAKIAESEKLYEQQGLYLDELKKIAPSEYNFQSKVTEQQKTRAEHILMRNKKKNQMTIEHGTISADEKEIIAQIKKQAQEHFSAGKAQASDFAYLLRTIGEQEMAVDFIYNKDESEQKDWELLDYLFYGRQFLNLLDHCSHMKMKHSDNPDALFSIYYIEAVAYWELGEKQMALDLMAELTSMRPNFKSASEILAQWKESFE